MREEEMPQLKALYDELWNDAKTLIRDMREGIFMYRFSGGLLLALSFFSFWTVTLVGLLKILVGNAEFIDYLNAFFGAFATVFFIWSGIRLLRLYRKLKKRYVKLLQMEKDVEE